MTNNQDVRPEALTGQALTLRLVAALPLLLAAQAAVSQTALSADESTAQAFSAITIMGEREAEQTPWATQTGREVLEQQQILNWSQFGSRAEPGVNFNTTNNSINIRGLDKNRVLTRIDGVRQPYLVDIRGGMGGVSGGLSSIDFNALSSIDVVRGADSSTVGSGAMGGVVDVRTLSPDDLLVPGQAVGFAAKSGYFSVDQSWLLNGAVAGQTQQGLKWLVQAGVQLGHETQNQGTVGGVGITRSEPNPDNYTQQNYLIKLQQALGNNHKVGMSGAYFDRQDDIKDLTANPASFAAGQSALTKTSSRQSVALDYAWAASDSQNLLDTFAAQAYWQAAKLSSNLNANRLAIPTGPYQRDNTLKEDSWGLQFDASKRLEGVVSQNWLFGGDWLGTTLTQFAGGKDTCPPPPYVGRNARFMGCRFFHNNQSDVPKTRGNQYALWAQNTLGFANDRFLLTPALRYDYYTYSPSVGSFEGNPTSTAFQSNSAQAWSPKLLATYRATQSLSLYAQYAFSFNAPTATQLYSRYGSPGTYLVSGNPTLKPEKGRGWELGTKYEDRQINASLTYFDNRYENFIESVTGRGTPQYPMFTQTFENLENVRIYGLEARSEWKLTSNWRVFGSLAWTVGRDRSNDRYLNSVAPLQSIAGVTYAEQQWGVTAQVAAAAARTKVANAKTDFQAPGYGIVDLTAYWRPAQLKGLSVQAGIFNVFDKTYWNALDVPSNPVLPLGAYTQPGRNFAVSLTYQY